MSQRLKRGGWPYSQPPNVPFEINWNSLQAKGLVAEWSAIMNYGRRPARELVREMRGTLGAGVSYVATENGPGWDFVASNINLGTAILNLAVPFTLEAWVKIDAFGGNAAIYERGGGAGTGIEWYTTAAREVKVWDGAQATLYTLPVGTTWHQGVLVVHGATCDYFSDGVRVATGVVWAYAQSGVSTAYLGQWTGAGDNFDGKILRFRAWDRILPDAVINSLYVPNTRWELYRPLTRRVWVLAPAAPPAGAMPMAMDHYRRRRV